jgi:hypothetical protein
MPSEFKHIDDFFRKKEQESTPGLEQQDQHWKQMQDLLAPNAGPALTIRTLNNRLFWQAAAVIIIAAGALLFLLHKKQPAENFTGDRVPPSIPRTYADPEKKMPQDNETAKLPLIRQTEKIPSKTSPKPDQTTIVLHPDSQALSPVATSENAEAVMNSFFQKLEKPVQEFVISASRDTVLYGSEGTSVHIPAGIFRTASGTPPARQLRFTLREFYHFGDMVANKLTTTSNGLPLITGGMVEIEAYSGEQKVTILPGKSIKVEMPAPSFDPAMELFTGQKLSGPMPSPTNGEGDEPVNTFSGSINWLPAGQRQAFFPGIRKMVKVLNLRDNPEAVVYRHEFNPSKIRSVAKFLLPWYSDISVEEARAKLMGMYGSRYGEIKVRKEWKPLFRKSSSEASHSAPDDWFKSPYIGDSVEMHITTASGMKLISKEDSLKYEERWKKQMQGRDFGSLYMSGTKERYQFQVQGLGWINCDRFSNYPPESLTNIRVRTGQGFDAGNVVSMLVFSRLNAVMPGYMINNGLEFFRIPKGEKVSIICIGVKNGETYCCIRDLQVSGEVVNDLDFRKTTASEFQEKLQQLGTIGRRG